jgi:hypothetical protein
MDSITQTSHVRRRLEDLAREIGTLLLAFTPLDAVLWRDSADHDGLLLTFLTGGIAFVAIALVSESRRLRG